MIFFLILLAALQGLTEFLPISSSAHLWLLPWFLYRPYQGLAIDAVLHLGTLFSLLIFFRKEIFQIFKDSLSRPHSFFKSELSLLIIAAIPAAFFGLLFEKKIETIFRNPLILAFNLFVFAILLLYAHYFRGSAGKIRVKEAILIGLVQVLSLLPGVSRSGITYSTARLLKVSPYESFRFSFLLSIPTILGATLLEFPKLTLESFSPVLILLLLFLTFLFGYLALWLFREIVISKRGMLFVFSYRVLLAILVFYLVFRRSV